MRPELRAAKDMTLRGGQARRGDRIGPSDNRKEIAVKRSILMILALAYGQAALGVLASAQAADKSNPTAPSR